MSRLLSLVLVSTVLLAGCGRKVEVTPLQRKQAAALVSEAEFALTVRDFARAEKLLVEATDIVSDNGGYWVMLGNLAKRNRHHDLAKKAYTAGSKAFAAAYKAESTSGMLLMRQMYCEALLGHHDQAKMIIQQARAKHPTEPEIKAFDDAAYDRMLANPNFKELAL